MSQEKKVVALSSVGASFLLTVVKLIVGLFTGSLGILSEAAHSALDLGAALVTYFAVRVSDKPADQEHHYGHGKIENLSALAEAILLLITCLWIIREAFDRLLYKHITVEINFWAFLVIMLSIVVDFNRARILRRTAKKYNSQALEADALHFSSDILSSIVVLAGLIFTRFFGITYADSIAALGVSALVIMAGLRLSKRAIDSLLDRAPGELVPTIEEDVLSVPGVKGIRNVRIRPSGGKYMGDLDLMVDPTEPLQKAHDLATQVEDKLSAYHTEVVIHLEPCMEECDNCGAKCNSPECKKEFE